VRKFSKWLISWFVALAVLILRTTCRTRLYNDPRDRLRAESQAYVYSVLHAHQIAAIIGGEPGTGAMVSRSADGALLVPSLRVRGIVPIRGSGRRHGEDKGGSTALHLLIDHVRSGKPAYLAVDGPRGPRNQVQKGIAVLSQRSRAAVLNIVMVPTRRWIFAKAWDRFQIPKPFCTIHAYFGEPILPDENEPVDQYRIRIEKSLNELEEKHDPDEARLCRSTARKPA
jgi:lysophospholipid acyltransferase (LPLAT)-like uncharacterized protein